MLAFAGLASVLGWSYMRGQARWVSLSGVWAVVVVSLVGAAACQALGLVDAADVLNVAALVLSLAALAAGPQLWEDQMRSDAESQRKHTAQLDARDVLSWRVWGAAVRRIGAGRSALLWLALFAAAWGANLGTAWATRPLDDRGYLLAALAAPAAFGILSAFWMYRGVSRVFPGPTD